jgi:ankyrin repeat protein
MLLTLEHLKPLAIAHLPAAMITEALRNSSAEEIGEAFQQNGFLIIYLRLQCKQQEQQLINILSALFSQVDLMHSGQAYEQTRRAMLSETLQQLGLKDYMTAGYWKTLDTIAVVKQLSQTLQALITEQTIYIIDNAQLLSNLLRTGMPHNLRDAAGNTLLMLSAQGGWLALSLDLINSGANINDINEHGQTALMLAAQNGHIQIIEQLWAVGATGTMISARHGDALTHAITAGQVAAAECLLNLQNKAMLRANQQDLPLLDQGLEASIHVNTHDPTTGKTALLWLFDSDFADPEGAITQAMLKLLLAHKADISACTYEGRSVLSYRRTFETGCFDILLAAGTRPYGEDSYWIMHSAVKTGQIAALKKLIQLGVPIHTRKDWETLSSPVDDAFTYGQFEIAILLLSHGQHSLTHTLRACFLEEVNHLWQAKTLPGEQAAHLFNLILHPDFLFHPDPLGDNFLDGFLKHDAVNRAEGILSPLLSLLKIVAHYTNLHDLTLKNGDTLLTHLRKQHSHDSGLQPVIHYLFHYPDKSGCTPFTALRQAEGQGTDTGAANHRK